MKNMIKTKKIKIIMVVSICMLLVSGAIVTKLLDVSFAVNYRKERTFKSGNGKYLIIGDEDLFVQYVNPIKTNAKSIEIPATVKYKGKTYRVVSVKEGAFSKSCNTLKKLTIGQNVVAIGRSAFSHCKKLKTVTIKTTHLRKDTVKSYAFYDINKKAVVIVPEEKLTEYKKILPTKNVGITEKTQKIQGKKMNISDIFKNTAYDPDAEITKIDTAMGLGGTWLITTEAVKEKQYEIGDTIEIDLRTRLDPNLFGYWKLNMLDSGEQYVTCWACGRTFDYLEKHNIPGLNSTFIEHQYVPVTGLYTCSAYGDFEKTSSQSQLVWEGIYNNLPCSMTFKITLPEGIEYQDDSVRLYYLFAPVDDIVNYGECGEKGYEMKVDGQEITVTFYDIKKSFVETFNKPFVLIKAKMTNKAAEINTIKASVTFNFKGEDLVFDFNDVTAIKVEE